MMFKTTISRIMNGDEILPSLIITPKVWVASDEGGPVNAEMSAHGPADALPEAFEWLGYCIKIHDEEGEPCWWGYIESVEMRGLGITFGYSLEQMYNAVRVLYNVEGQPEPVRTDWGEDQWSISRFGRKELTYSSSDLSQERAEKVRDELLTKFSLPNRIVSADSGGASPEIILRARGFWSWLEWTYYEQTAGKVTQETTGFSYPVGYSYTSNEIALSNTKLYCFQDVLQVIPADTYIEVSGTANNGTRTAVVTTAATDPKERVVISSAAIYFDPGDDVYGADFSKLRVDELIKISGATNSANNGWAKVGGLFLDASPERFETSGHAIVSEAASARVVTIEQGQSLETDINWRTEFPGNTITIKVLAQRLGQRVNVTSATNWIVGRVGVYAGRIGTPTDEIVVELHADSSGSIGSLITSGTIPGINLSKEPKWFFADFPENERPTVGTGGGGSQYFWIVVYRSGSTSGTDFYTIEMVRDTEWTGDAVKYWNGSSWNTFPYEGKTALTFQALGTERADVQLGSILASTGKFTAIGMGANSPVESPQFRDGSNTCLDEASELIKNGLYARVLPDGSVLITERVRTIQGAEVLELTIDGKLRYGGMDFPLGHLPNMDAPVKVVPPILLGGMVGEPFLLSSIEFDADNMRWQPTAEAGLSPFEFAERLSQG